MDDNDKHTLEGLLQARSQDLRQGRRRGRRPVADPSDARPAAAPGPAEPATRSCDECGRQIDARRLSALPRATQCLACRRAAERAGTPS